MKTTWSALAAMEMLSACGPMTSGTDAGADAGSSVVDDGGVATFRTFTAPSTTAVNGSFLFTITGEATATEGFAFPPPAGAMEPYFIDGWEVRYEHMLVTVDGITLAENPDMSPGNPGMTGAAVARATGPWAVDLAKPRTRTKRA